MVFKKGYKPTDEHLSKLRKAWIKRKKLPGTWEHLKRISKLGADVRRKKV